MKFIHLSDLHLGKRVNEFSMLEDQEYILLKIIEIVEAEKPDGALIAGDVYDKSVPSAEAVKLFDDFLVRLARRGVKTFVISGNHDSPERIAFGGRIMDASGVYLSPAYDGKVGPVRMRDAYGALDVYLLPFIRPAWVRELFPGEETATYADVVRLAIRHMEIDPQNRNVLVTHQFVAGASRCDSEDVCVGGAESIDAEAFAAFDYTALGHLHGPQFIKSPSIRYCGSPLKYSFSEVGHEKSVTIVEFFEKGRFEVRTVPLIPRVDMAEIRGTFAEIDDPGFRSRVDASAYLRVTLTDEQDVPDALGKLRLNYPNIMKLDYDNVRTRCNAVIAGADGARDSSPAALFAEFYEKQNNGPMSEEQQTFVQGLIEKIWGETQ